MVVAVQCERGCQRNLGVSSISSTRLSAMNARCHHGLILPQCRKVVASRLPSTLSLFQEKHGAQPGPTLPIRTLPYSSRSCLNFERQRPHHRLMRTWRRAVLMRGSDECVCACGSLSPMTVLGMPQLAVLTGSNGPCSGHPLLMCRLHFQPVAGDPLSGASPAGSQGWVRGPEAHFTQSLFTPS